MKLHPLQGAAVPENCAENLQTLLAMHYNLLLCVCQLTYVDLKITNTEYHLFLSTTVSSLGHVITFSLPAATKGMGHRFLYVKGSHAAGWPGCP
jgi:hypothetical protein